MKMKWTPTTVNRTQDLSQRPWTCQRTSIWIKMRLETAGWTRAMVRVVSKNLNKDASLQMYHVEPQRFYRAAGPLRIL